MNFDARWAAYARIQAAARLATSINQSDANDVRLDRIIDCGTCSGPIDLAAIERAVRSNGRKARHRDLSRRSSAHAIAPGQAPCPEKTAIWKQAWSLLEGALSVTDLRLLALNETVVTEKPMHGTTRTRLSRIRSSLAYRRVRSEIFAHD